MVFITCLENCNQCLPWLAQASEWKGRKSYPQLLCWTYFTVSMLITWILISWFVQSRLEVGMKNYWNGGRPTRTRLQQLLDKRLYHEFMVWISSEFWPAWVVVMRLSENNMPPNGYGSIPIDTFLVEWTSIYQLFWCSPGVQGFDTLPYGKIHLLPAQKHLCRCRQNAIDPPPNFPWESLWCHLQPTFGTPKTTVFGQGHSSNTAITIW